MKAPQYQFKSPEAREHHENATKKGRQARRSAEKFVSTPVALAKATLLALALVGADAGLSYWQSNGNLHSMYWTIADTFADAVTAVALYGVARSTGRGLGAVFHTAKTVDHVAKATVAEGQDKIRRATGKVKDEPKEEAPQSPAGE